MRKSFKEFIKSGRRANKWNEMPILNLKDIYVKVHRSRADITWLDAHMCGGRVMLALPQLLLVVSYSPPHWNWSAIARMRRNTEKGILLFPSIIIISILYIVRSIFPIILALFAYCAQCEQCKGWRILFPLQGSCDGKYYSFVCGPHHHLCAKDMNTINKKKIENIERKFSFLSHNISICTISLFI